MAGAVVMLIGFSYMLRPMDGDFNRDTLPGFYAEEKNSLDVVTIGSSAIYRFWNLPYAWEEYGITSYNLATNQQQSEHTLPLMKEALKTQNPDLFLVEMRAYCKYSDDEDKLRTAFRRVSDNMSYSWDRIRMINEHTVNWKDRFELYFDIIFYHSQWEGLDIERLDYVDNEKKLKRKGWENIYKVRPLNAPLDYTGLVPKAIDEKQETDLRKLLSYCKENEIEVLFVLNSMEMTKTRAQRSLYVESIVEEYGYDYLDCNLMAEKIGLDYSKDFYDRMHVNVGGSQKVTKFLADYMLEHYDMELSHSKAIRKEWDTVAKENSVRYNMLRK